MKVFIFGYGFVSSVILKDNKLSQEDIFIVSRKIKEFKKNKNITYLPYEKSFEILKEIKPDVLINCVGILKGKYSLL